MVFTRADGKLALTHVIENVFQLPIKNPLTTALTQAGIIEIGDILCMPYDDMLDLTYMDGKGDKYPFSKGYKYRLRAFKYCHLHWIATGDPIGDTWLSLTQKEYNEYCVSQDDGATLKDYNDFAEMLGFIQDDFHEKGRESLLTLPSVTSKLIVNAITSKLIVNAITSKSIVNTIASKSMLMPLHQNQLWLLSLQNSC
jgi:hypothetical protein